MEAGGETYAVETGAVFRHGRRYWRRRLCLIQNNNKMTPTQNYLNRCKQILEVVSAQENLIRKAAEWFSGTILAGRMVHVFGSGHSRIMVEEMWPRYGSFPGFNPIVELDRKS